jgi:hypothetical protein
MCRGAVLVLPMPTKKEAREPSPRFNQRLNSNKKALPSKKGKTPYKLSN